MSNGLCKEVDEEEKVHVLRNESTNKCREEKGLCNDEDVPHPEYLDEVKFFNEAFVYVRSCECTKSIHECVHTIVEFTKI